MPKLRAAIPPLARRWLATARLTATKTGVWGSSRREERSPKWVSGAKYRDTKGCATSMLSGTRKLLSDNPPPQGGGSGNGL